MTQVLRLVQQVPLTNDNFEGGVTGWTNNGWGDAVAQSSTQKHSGRYSLKAGDTTSTYGQTIPGTTVANLKAATTYIFFVWVYIPSATPTLTTAAIRVHQTSTGGTLMATSNFLTQANATRNAWFLVSISFTTTSAGTYAPNLQFDDNNAGSHTEYLDDARLYEQLVDLQGTKHTLNEFSEDGIGDPFGTAKLNFDVRGTSISDLFDNLITLGRALLVCKQNKSTAARGGAYAPVFLQFQPGASTYTLQTECFGLTPDAPKGIDKILANPQALLSNRIENLNVPLQIRGYWEELTREAVSGSPFTSANDTGSMTISGLRGDLPAPLRIKTRVATTNQTQIIAALKAQDTPANFIGHFDLNTAAGTGYSVTLNGTYVSNQNDADDFINGKGCRVTPDNTLDAASEIAFLVRVLFTSNPGAFTGRMRGLVRARDNHATTPNFYLRMRTVLVDSGGSVRMRGDYWDYAKAALVVSTTGGVPQALIDCGVGNIPLSQLGASAPYQPGVEILGYSTDTAGHATFDLDELFLLPAHEGDGSGMIVVNLAYALGNGANPDGVIDARDRVPRAAMVDDSDVVIVGPDAVSGNALYAYPNQSQVLFLYTRQLSTGKHTHGVDNTVTVDYMPRYRLGRGS